MMRTWYSTKPCLETTKSQVSHAVVDSAWEHYTAQVLEKRTDVAAYAKNDHLGFQLYYLRRGSRRKYVPDFLIRLANGKYMVLEIKGEDSDQNRSKRRALMPGCGRSTHAAVSAPGAGRSQGGAGQGG